MFKTREFKNFKVGAKASMDLSCQSAEGVLYKCPVSNDWYLFNNMTEGAKPIYWIQEKQNYKFSFWLGGGGGAVGSIGTGLISAYEITLLEDPSLPDLGNICCEITLPKNSFIPKIGDILRILSQGDVKRLNEKETLSGGGEFFGMNFLITCVSAKDGPFHTITGDIYDGVVLVKKGWLLDIRDFCEFHNISFISNTLKGPCQPEVLPGPSKPILQEKITNFDLTPKSTLIPTQDFQVRGDATIKNSKRDIIILLDL